MKRIFTYLILFTLTASICQAQRYDTEIFDRSEIQVETALYGFNYTIITIPSTGHTFKQPLVMDIYRPPAADQVDNPERPLVLLFHTGNFLPPVTNGQIAGTKNDSSAVEICYQLAQRGFVAASVEYRDGWNPLAGDQPTRALGLIQAAYRGGQDGRTAVRYMKKTFAEDGNPWGIDPNKIATWGNGTGSYLVLGMNGLNNFSEIVTTQYPAGKFLLDVDMDGTPETPMVWPANHGDLEGTGDTITIANGNYGLPPGDTTNFPNHVDYTSEHQLTISVGGALGDLSWLEGFPAGTNAQTIPIIYVQSWADQFAPYDDAILRVPTTGDPIVRVQGLKAVSEYQESSGMNQAWKDFGFDDAVTQLAMANSGDWINPVDSMEIGHPYYEGGFSWKKPNNNSGFDEGVVINWWEPTDPTPTTSECMGLPWSQCPQLNLDPTGNTSFHQAGFILNEGMSAAKAKANIATIMEYVIPRACITLELGCLSVSTDEVLLSSNLVEVAPNPATGYVNVTSVEHKPIKDIEVYSINGQLLNVERDINVSQSTVNLTNQTPGMYVMKIYMEEGIVTKKLMVQ